MASGVITPKIYILRKALRLHLEQVMTSTSFECHSNDTKLWVPSQQGQKSPKDVTSLLVELVESHEVVSLQGP